ncbi:MAG TPA: TonB-dependent receptor [Porticoccaceae bacterium]|nr:TonB-dependent receptor [Porticoccaceae bacterium]
MNKKQNAPSLLCKGRYMFPLLWVCKCCMRSLTLGFTSFRSPNKNKHLPTRVLAGFLLAVTSTSHADEHLSHLKTLSLDELVNIQVSISSKRPEKAGDVAASLHVITSEDIHRSGASTIPELLRTVPGLNVAQSSANYWSITARGSGGRFANKLLVMMDGRTLYTPLFSGVFWEIQDALLEDIERIEIVRGSGAAIWGANAVNGVINIITKKPGDTQGGLIYTQLGDQDQGSGGVRYGGAISDEASYRVYAQYSGREESVLPGGFEAADDMDSLRGGFRVDWHNTALSSLRLQGDIYSSHIGEQASVPNLFNTANDYKDVISNEIDYSGANLILAWEQQHPNEDRTSVQFYYDRIRREDSILGDYNNETFNVEYQYQRAPQGRHKWVWGFGYRLFRDNFDVAADFIAFTHPNDYGEWFSAYLQDDISFYGGNVVLTGGLRLDHNQYTGLEAQPSIRVRWHITPRTMAWTALSRAVRTPGKIDEGGRISFRYEAPSPTSMGLPLEAVGMLDDLESESVLSYELGYRWQATEGLNLDIVAFYADYDKFRSFEEPTVQFLPSPVPHLQAISPGDNKIGGEAFGLELAMEWLPRDWWRLRANASALYMDLRAIDGGSDTTFVRNEDETPEHQFNLISTMNLHSNFFLDAVVRYVDKVKAFEIDSYVAFDARIAWQPTPDVEFSLVGKNLFDDSHPEYIDALLRSADTEIERSVLAKVVFNF